MIIYHISCFCRFLPFCLPVGINDFYWSCINFIFYVIQNISSLWCSSLLLCLGMGFSGGSVVKNLPAMQETWVWSLVREDPLEKEIATHSSSLAFKMPWTEEPGRLQPTESQGIEHDWATSLHLQYSCWEIPWTRVACWATAHRVTKSHTQLKRPSSHTLAWAFLPGF